MLDRLNEHLATKGIKIATGTLVGATMLSAPSSTKNEKQERDPALRQTRKGQQWYLGLKAHIGVDSKTNVVHSICTSAASVSDCHLLVVLLHGEERKVWGDAGYEGRARVIRQAAPQAQDRTSRSTKYNRRPDELQKNKTKTRSKVRTMVEYPFRIHKRVFDFDKVRYRALPGTTIGGAPTSR
jgi:IS5 family transposase